MSRTASPRSSAILICALATVIAGIGALIFWRLTIHPSAGSAVPPNAGSILAPCNQPLASYSSLNVTYGSGSEDQVAKVIEREGGTIVQNIVNNSVDGSGSYIIRLSTNNASAVRALQGDPDVDSVTPAGVAC